ncbi:Mu transposase C-terminal domain-containing protein [Metapseudomonas otitidis]|uniref:Mu transposase C-terminal domain-containing protein n=1 Tax=Metapseudomonas otitidis TaxID=319939 RepID=UPI003A8909F2
MKTSTLHIAPGAILKVDEQVMCVLRFTSSSEVEVLVGETGSKKIISLSEISRSVGAKSVPSSIDLDEIDPDAWKEAVEKFYWLEPLMFKPGRTHADVQAVADELLTSRISVYRWLKKLEEHRSIRCLLRRGRSDAGKKRIDPKVEAVIQDVIREKYLNSLKPSPTATYKELKNICRREGLPCPSKVTLLNRIDEILPMERELKRNGHNASLKHSPNRGSLPGVNGLYSKWQIDHTLVDIELVDSVDRIAIGRPWITMVIDTFSRMVVGWYISFDPPGTIGTGLAITNAILPKDSWMRELGVKYDWPCQGKPRVIHCDNAKEFQGTALENASLEHGFLLQFRKKKKPQYGAYIERYLGTLGDDIHAVDGSTFENIGVKAEYDSAGNAVLTLNNFQRWLANLILGEYHQKIHSGLKGKNAELESEYADEPRSPLMRFQEGLYGGVGLKGLGMLPISANPDQLYMDFLPVFTRTIQTYGVRWEHIDYYDAILDKWIGAKSVSSKREAREFRFRYDPRDISKIYFWEPELKKYFEIGYRNMTRPPISYWELKAVRSFIEKRGVSAADVDEETIFRSCEARRVIVDDAKNLTRAAARERERQRAHRAVATKTQRPARSAAMQPQLSDTSKGANTPSLKQIDLQNLPEFDEFEEA